MSDLHEWFEAGRKILEAHDNEDNETYMEGINAFRDLIESPTVPGVSVGRLGDALVLVENATRGHAMPVQTMMRLAVEISKYALGQFKQGEQLWREPAHRKMEEMRGVIQMEIAVEKAELVELLRRSPTTMGTIPTRDVLVELFNQPAPTDEKPIVHGLMEGRSFCPMSFVFSVPGHWPKGHKWAAPRDPAKPATALDTITCTLCIKAVT
jgi:hypothetical protein